MNIEGEIREIDCTHSDKCKDAGTYKCFACKHNKCNWKKSYYEPVGQPYTEPRKPINPWNPPIDPTCPAPYDIPYYPWGWWPYTWSVTTSVKEEL